MFSKDLNYWVTKESEAKNIYAEKYDEIIRLLLGGDINASDLGPGQIRIRQKALT
jgi:hypothetical protein